MKNSLISRWSPLVTLISAFVGFCMLSEFTPAYYMRLCCWGILTGISLVSFFSRLEPMKRVGMYPSALTSLLIAAFLLSTFGSPILAFSAAVAGYHRPITGVLLPILLAVGQTTGIPPIYGLLASAFLTLIHDFFVLEQQSSKTELGTSTATGADGLVSIFDVLEGKIDANPLG